MKQLTKEQVKILSAYEQHFETAVKRDRKSVV